MIDVLVVDDDFMVARIHTGFVARTPGFAVAGTVHTGADALRTIGRLAPDLVLLDLYLPDMTGLEVLRQIRETFPEVDVLVVTAAREAETVRRALRGGIVHYLMKPFTYEDLRARLEHYETTHRGLAAAATADQADVDRLFGVRPGSASPQHLPKGVSAETAQLVSDALRAADGTLSAAQCAHVVGISRVSARRYLEHFVAVGSAEVRLRYGAAGRPERRYGWREA
ncbi:MAG: two-component system response regulator [Cryptosporangiaceae bacterium]|nr:two-component system response regulator [Cryptosporangiaceae bacterium]